MHSPSPKKPQTTFIVSLDIYSDLWTVEQINQLLHAQPSTGSRNKGEHYYKDRIAPQTRWRYESPKQTTDLDHALLHIADWLDQDDRGQRLRACTQLEPLLTIAALFHTAYASVRLPADLIRRILPHIDKIEVVSYPCDDTEPGAAHKPQLVGD